MIFGCLIPRPRTPGPSPIFPIPSSSAGATIGENATAQSTTGIEKIEYLAFYDGYDEGGDGIYKDWHYMYQPAILNFHAGDVLISLYQVKWDNFMIPEQSGIKLVARIRETNGISFVTNVVDNIILARTNASVKVYKAYNIPTCFWVVEGRGGIQVL